MAKHSFPNPDHIYWSPEVQDEYLKYARDFYISKQGNPLEKCDNWWWHITHAKDRCPKCPPTHQPHQSLLEALYDDGRLHGYLRLPFREFERNILVGTSRRWKKAGHGWIRNGVYSQKASSRYRKPANPSPTSAREEESERREARTQWRDAKGFTRDYRRGRCKYNRGGHRGWAKTHSNRIHRRWERRQIQKECWDDSISDYRKWTHDPWMWD